MQKRKLGNSGLEVRHRLLFQAQVAGHHFAGFFADQELAELLKIGQAIEKQDALDELVGMLHFVNRFLVFVLRQLGITPVAIHARVEEILVDRSQLVEQGLVQVLNDFGIALHAASLHAGIVVQRANACRPRL